MIRIWIGSVSKCITCYPGCKSFSIVWQWFTPKHMAFYDGHFSKTERINTDFTWCRTLTNVIFQLFLILLCPFKLQWIDFTLSMLKGWNLCLKLVNLCIICDANAPLFWNWPCEWQEDTGIICLPSL